MTVNRTTLLDLPLPVTGTESGTWGDTTNNGLTQYLDIAIAGTLVLSTDADVTLTSTEGDSSATNIGATTAQYAILRWTATGSTTRNITALAQSKTYVVINATGGTQSIVLRGAGPTTGVTIISGEKALCVWNGSDFVKVSSSAAAGGSNTQVQYNSSGVLAGSSNLTFDGTSLTLGGNPTLSAGTANGVLYLNGSKVTTSGSALTFDGTTFQYTGAANFATSSGNVGIGTSSPSYKLDVTSASDASLLQIKSTASANNTAMRFGIDGNNSFINASGGSTGVLQLRVFGTTQATLDASGNLGLGVTPSAWVNGWKAFQNGSGALSNSGTGIYTATQVSDNAYFTGSGANLTTSTYIYSSIPATNYKQYNGQHQWHTAPSGTAGNAITFTQAMTLDASGNLGVGETSIAADTRLHLKSAGDIKLKVETTNNTLASGNAALVLTTGSYGYTIQNLTTTAGSAGVLRFYDNTAAAERARITSGGYFKASDSGTYVSSTGAYHELDQSANQETLVLNSTNASQTSTTLLIQSARNTTNNTYYAIDYYNTGAAAYKFRVADSGNVTNTNGTYGTISDAKMKTDIVDAGSQWADVKAIRFRKFKMKNDPSGLLQLGVIAQELEQTSPGLVDEHVDRDAEGNDLGTTTKSVKTSILLMKAAKALQEAMTRIETLEAKVSALEGN